MAEHKLLRKLGFWHIWAVILVSIVAAFEDKSVSGATPI